VTSAVFDLPIVKREREFAKAWRPIGLNGTPMDEPHIDRLIAFHEREKEACRQRVAEATNGQITNPKSSAEVPVCLAALGYPLPASEKTGKPGAPKGVLEPFAASVTKARELFAKGDIDEPELRRAEAEGDTLCADILEYRRHDTALGLLLRPMKALCEYGDSRLRSSIMSIEARTGRTSSRNMNMQQFSRQGGMRSSVRTEPGTRGISADFQSVEIRVGAALSQDPTMMELIRNTDLYPEDKKLYDLHWRTAIICYGENATKENRYNSKRVNFGTQYGGGVNSLSAQVGIPVPEVRRAKEAFQQLAPRYFEWDAEMRAYVRAGNRSWMAYSGRIIWMDPKAEHGAGNSAIQGTARELLVDAVEKWMAGPWSYATLLVVHDELVAYGIPAEEADLATAFLVHCMETELYGVGIKAEANEPWEAWPDAS
jgi:hypothetical protein